MKIAVITHSYHRHTQSNRFFLDLLRTEATVDVFYDSTWRGEREPWIDSFDSAAFDCVVIWQVHYPFEYVHHPNLVFVPMYDDIVVDGRLCWSDQYNRAKVVCFSSELHRIAPAPVKRLFRYFPDPSQFPVCEQRGLRGFFWKRVRSIDERGIAALSGETVFDRFTLHAAPDPLSGADPVDDATIRAGEISRCGWHKNREDYLAKAAAHNVFFAARPFEGIGMSFLEAMAMGMCVVAPDTPTHNEYIRHGDTGLLYRPADPQPLNLRCAAEIGARARRSIEGGFEKWSAAQADLVNFVTCFA